jgi:hypothetical protein
MSFNVLCQYSLLGFSVFQAWLSIFSKANMVFTVNNESWCNIKISSVLTFGVSLAIFSNY